jgi:hypothetical protein
MKKKSFNNIVVRGLYSGKGGRQEPYFLSDLEFWEVVQIWERGQDLHFLLGLVFEEYRPKS